MYVAFYYEYGEIPEVGTGHYWRSQAISSELIRRGHRVTHISESSKLTDDVDILVIDHVHSQADLIELAHSMQIKTVLIDGQPEDADLTNTSISAFYNPKAQHRGIEHIAFTKCQNWIRYKPSTKSRTVFVGMGGFDACMHAELVLNVLDRMGVNAIVAKSINHPNFKERYSRVEIFNEENYYNAFSECVMAITNGGLTLFQALHYGLPCLALAQYEHQKNNISQVAHCCIPIEPDEGIIETRVGELLNNEYQRQSLSLMAQHHVDGKGIDRICKIIEDLR